MSKDIAEKRLEWHNDVFVDIFNNVLFEGTEVLKEENLTSIPTQSYVRAADGTVHENNRDIRKVDKEQNVYRLVCGLENQTGRENTMPERVMGYDYAAYEEQIKELEELNRLQNRPAYAQRIHEDQKLAPVVTGVLNWGNEEWKGPMDLHDMIRFPAENEAIIKPLVPNYPMNLIEVRKLPKEVRERLTSDFRLIADYFVGRKDKASLKKLFADQTHKIKHPEEFLDVLSEVASDVQYKELKKILTKEQKEELTMCIIADELVGQGRIEGRQAGLQEGRQAGLQEGRRAGLQEGRQAGLQEGRQAGLQEGRREGQLDTICSLIKGGMLKIEEGAAFLNITIDEMCGKLEQGLA